MQQVMIFANTSMNALELMINEWLKKGQVKLVGASYTADHQNNFYSALLYYVPSHSSLMKQWRESK